MLEPSGGSGADPTTELDGDAMQAQWVSYSKRPLCRALVLQFGLLRIIVAMLRAKWAKRQDRASELWKSAGASCAKVLLALGPTYVKLGQIASCRADLLPAEYIEELKCLQDRVPAFSGQRAARFIEAELGKPLDKLLQSFSEKPLAAASLGQVHKAVTLDGQEVAIKVQRSDLKQMYDLDLSQMERVMRILDCLKVRVAGAKQKWMEIYQDAKVLIYREIDYLAEASNMTRFRKNFEEDGRCKWLKVPEVIDSLTTSKVLTMEFVPGVKISDVKQLDVMPVDRLLLANRLAEAYLLSFCKYGFFNTDPHPGNLAVDTAFPGGRIIFYDFGQTCELHENQGKGILQVIQAIIDLDAEASVQGMLNLGMLTPDADLQVLEADIARSFASGKVRSRVSRGPTPREDAKQAMARSPAARYIQVPASLAFATRAFAELQGVSRLLDEDWEFIASVAGQVTRLQVEQGAGIQYIASQIVKSISRTQSGFQVGASPRCFSGVRSCWPPVSGKKHTRLLPRSASAPVPVEQRGRASFLDRSHHSA